MPPQILLINPWVYDFAAFDLWARPLGQLYLGEALIRLGCDVRLVDCLDRLHPAAVSKKLRPARYPGAGHWLRQVVPAPAPYRGIPRTYARYGLPEPAFTAALKAGPKPELVLVTSSMTYWYPGCFRAIELTRRVWPDVKIILGGTYASLCGQHARDFSGADLVITGPAETRIQQLLKEAGTIDPPGSACRWEDLRPALSLYPKLEFAPLMTSRGCPFACPYCASARLFPGFIQRPGPDIFAEIVDRHTRLGLTDFVFFDDALLVNAERHLTPVLQQIISHGLKIRFHAPNGLHVGLITRDLAELMYRAGFRTIRLGLETLDWNKQAAWGHKVRINEFEAALDHLVAAGFKRQEIGVYLLYGLPGQTLGEVRETVMAVKALGAAPYLAEFSPLPGTPLWEEAKKCSRFDLESEPLYHNNTFFPCRSEDFSWEKVSDLKRLARGRP